MGMLFHTNPLKNFYFNEFDLKYYSVSREMLINLLIKNIKNKIEIKEINKSCVGIIQKNSGKLEVLMDNEELLSADIIIGADGVNGVTRKYVCGTTNIVTKKVFRGISDDKNKLYNIGCIGKIHSFSETTDGRYLISLQGLSLIHI